MECASCEHHRSDHPGGRRCTMPGCRCRKYGNPETVPMFAQLVRLTLLVLLLSGWVQSTGVSVQVDNNSGWRLAIFDARPGRTQLLGILEPRKRACYHLRGHVGRAMLIAAPDTTLIVASTPVFNLEADPGLRWTIAPRVGELGQLLTREPPCRTHRA